MIARFPARPLSLLMLAASLAITGHHCLSAAGAEGPPLVVDGSSRAQEEDGTQDRPFKTIQKAADAARPGTTVLVKAGTYRESILLKHGGTANAPIILRAMPPGSAVVDGADPIIGFQPASMDSDAVSVWYCSTYKPIYSQLPKGTIDRWTKQGPVGFEQIEVCSREDAIFLDGRHLDEVAARNRLVPDSYWIDRQAGGIYLGLNKGEKAGDHLVEGSVRVVLLSSVPDCSYVQIRGFHFTRAADTFQSAAVQIGSVGHDAAGKVSGFGRGWVFADNLVDWNGWLGMGIHGSDHQILNNTFDSNGNQGVGGSHCTNLLLDGNASTRNNYKKIRTGFEGGGGKFVLSDHVTIRNHEAAYNIGPGLWFDIDNKEVTIEHCTLHNNEDGMSVEISAGPTMIQDNVIYKNTSNGILIAESSNTVVDNNILASNGYGINLRNLQGRHGSGADSKPDPSDTLQYQLANVSISHNIFFENAKAGIVNTNKNIDVVAARISSNENVFSKNPAVWWKVPDAKDAHMSDDGTFTPPVSEGYWVLNTPQDAAKKLGLESHSRNTGVGPKFDLSFVNVYPWPDELETAH